jgi:hypothetical protein
MQLGADSGAKDALQLLLALGLGLDGAENFETDLRIFNHHA